MNIRTRILIICTCLVVASLPASARDAMQKITTNVYAYTDIQNAGVSNSFGANAGIIIGKESIAVIDTLDTALEAREMIAQVRSLSKKPIKYVINTHFHYDHSLGNSEFERLGTTIISHEKCRENLIKYGDYMIESVQKMGLSSEQMAGTTPVYPKLVFQKKAMLDLGEMQVELHYIAPGHAPDGILIYIPQERVVFTGDNLFTDFHAFVGTADLDGWHKNLDYLMELDADYFVPGHGPLSGKEDISDQKEYLARFDQKAKELCSTTYDLDDVVEQMKKTLPPKPQGQWMIKGSLQRKYCVKNQSE